jgi:hypothetical protein
MNSKILALPLLIGSCSSVREVTICQISFADHKAYCAKDGEKFELDLSKVDGWFAVDETDLRKIGDKLAECEKDGGN